MAVEHPVSFYTNNGVLIEEELSSSPLTVNSNGCVDRYDTQKYTYDGANKFIGFAITPNATEPTYAIGSSIEFSYDGISLYIIEDKSETSNKVEITYNDNVIASLEAGQTATLQCNGKKMVSDVIVTTPEITDSPSPIKISTEAEMNALLETAEVGSVFKFTGETTDTYENGALYAVEEEAVTLISFTIAGTSYQAEEGMTWGDWVNSEYNTNGWTDDGEYVYNSFGADVTFVSTDGTLSGRVTPNETIINGTDYDTRDA